MLIRFLADQELATVAVCQMIATIVIERVPR